MCKGYGDDYELYTGLYWAEDKDIDFFDTCYEDFRLWINFLQEIMKINLKHQLRSLFKTMDFVSKNFLTKEKSGLSKGNFKIYFNIYQQLGLAWEYLGLQCRHGEGYKKIKKGKSACKICGRIRGVEDAYYLLPRRGHKIIGKRISPNSQKIFRNRKEALLLEDTINFHGAQVNVDVHNRYKSKLFKSEINIADERSVNLTERGIKCSVDQRMVLINLDGDVKKTKRLPYSGFAWELRKETLRKFPVLFDFDKRGRLLGVMILR